MIPMLVSFAAFVLSFALAAKLLDGMKVNGGVGALLIGAVVYGLFSAFFSWLLVVVIGALTFGLGWLLAPITYLVANALLLLLAGKLTSRLTVDGFGTALKASFLMALFGWVARHLVGMLT